MHLIEEKKQEKSMRNTLAANNLVPIQYCFIIKIYPINVISNKSQFINTRRERWIGRQRNIFMNRFLSLMIFYESPKFFEWSFLLDGINAYNQCIKTKLFKAYSHFCKSLHF